ncbi:MAG: DUF1015 family protein [archaeon]
MVRVKEFKIHKLNGLKDGKDAIKHNTELITEFYNAMHAHNTEAVAQMLDGAVDEPSFYYYEIEFDDKKKRGKGVLRGYVGLLGVEEYGSNIFNHENYFETLAEEIWGSLRHCGISFSPIMVLYPNTEEGITSIEPPTQLEMIQSTEYNDMRTGNVTHRIYRICDDGWNAEFKKRMQSRWVVIADGHHRYVASKKLSESDCISWVPTMFMDENSGMVVLSFTRVVKNMDLKLFDKITHAYPFSRTPVGSMVEMEHEIELMQKTRFGLFYIDNGEDKYEIMEVDAEYFEKYCRDNEEYSAMGVKLLHSLALDKAVQNPANNIEYTTSREHTKELIKNGYQIGIFMGRYKPQDIIQKGKVERRIMPQKATCCIPKTVPGIGIWKFR